MGQPDDERGVTDPETRERTSTVATNVSPILAAQTVVISNPSPVPARTIGMIVLPWTASGT
jgi:hypothetical protein